MKDIAQFSQASAATWSDKHQSKLSLEKATYQQFQRQWKAGHFKGQRLGQAFYNFFRLHRLANQTQLLGLYEQEGEVAEKTIQAVFNFT